MDIVHMNAYRLNIDELEQLRNAVEIELQFRAREGDE